VSGLSRSSPPPHGREKNISRRKRYVLRRKKKTHKDLGNLTIFES